ncbi:hypothetical protein BDN70DRAFT_870397 [Pholiota conissans]|uniref:Uncharacterized protein n=1 Tax=Pholiota conissans TaxID=109636 RepID=A0A9P6D051_9AGAR|nr:hypothetical protein BDN70DRAFT_870397 [Pholiota conissans]
MFANYAPAILSDIIEDVPVPYFPRRRTFILNEEAKRILSLHLDEQVIVPQQKVFQLSEPVSRFSCSSPIISISSSSTASVSILDEPLEHVLFSSESISVFESDLSGNFPCLLDENLDDIPELSWMEEPLDCDSSSVYSLRALDGSFMPETSLMEASCLKLP